MGGTNNTKQNFCGETLTEALFGRQANGWISYLLRWIVGKQVVRMGGGWNRRREAGCENGRWMEPSQNRTQWRALALSVLQVTVLSQDSERERERESYTTAIHGRSATT
jgi:hypothetical protein